MNKLDLNKIEVKLDTLLENETTESLTNWLKEKRDKNNNMAQTLEEAALNCFKFIDHKNTFISGAKWMQERMYSEEEVRKLSTDFFYYWYNAKGNNTEQGFDEWFEQFKKQ